MKALKIIALLIFVFAIYPSIGIALAGSIDDSQKRFITSDVGDAQSAVSSEDGETVHELFTDAEPYVKQAEDESDPALVRSRFVRVNLDRLDEYESIVLNFFEDMTITAVRWRVEYRSEGRYTWFGEVPGNEFSDVVLTIENGILVGGVRIGGKLYRVEPLEGGPHIVRELDPTAFPRDTSSDFRVPDRDFRLTPPSELQEQQLQNDDGSTIDIMVVYTDDAASSSIGAQIQYAVDLTNATYAKSFINQRLRLVHTAQVNYAETGDAQATLDCITYDAVPIYPGSETDSCLNEIHVWRDQYRADLVCLWVEDMMNCGDWDPLCWFGGTRGIAWILPDLNTWYEYKGFSVVVRKYAADDFVFAHETGHNMGAGHDFHTPKHSGIFDYSHGYVWTGCTTDITCYCRPTVMAYYDYCDRAKYLWTGERIGRWSNPNITWKICEWPFDWPCTNRTRLGIPGSTENARTLNETAYIVANFRQSNLPPVCDANGPYVAECGGAATQITLDGTGSSDPDDDLLTYSWTSDCPGAYFDDNNSPTPTLIVDTSNGCNIICNVNLTVTDELGLSDACETTVTIQDTMTPNIICPDDRTIECDESSDPGNTGESIATDDCDSNPTINFSDVVVPGDCPNEETITRTWTATDYCANSSSCVQTIDVVDTTKADIACNTPATGTITPPDAPISFTATATDNCDDDPLVKIVGYDCYFYTKKGKRIDKTEGCEVEIEGDTITILDSGGVGTYINWTVLVTDDCGNETEMECEVKVSNPGKQSGKQ